MNDEDDDDDLGGGVDRDLLGHIARRDVLSIPTRDASDPAAILSPVVDVVKRALALGDVFFGDCAFLVSSYPEEDAVAFPDGKKIRHFTRSRKPAIAGKLYVANPGLDSVLSVDAPCEDLGELHDWLEHRLLDRRPLVAIRAEEKLLVWYPDGIVNEAASRELPITTTGKIDGAAIEDMLAFFHDRHTREHRTGAKFWSDAKGRVPCDETETAIQEDLRLVLETGFRHIGQVFRHLDIRGSKIDFAIFEANGRQFDAACALELKVFREYHFPKSGGSPKKCAKATNLAALESGIEQAATARNNLPAALAYVASYDMRGADDDEPLQAKSDLAARLNVTCKRYYMETAAKDYRKSVLAQPRVTRGKWPPKRSIPSKPR